MDMSSPVAFYHSGRDPLAVVGGDDFAFTELDGDLDLATHELVKHYEIKNRGRWGSDPQDVKEIDVFGRTVRLREMGAS